VASKHAQHNSASQLFADPASDKQAVRANSRGARTKPTQANRAGKRKGGIVSERDSALTFCRNLA